MTEPAPLVPVLFVGTFHMDNPGRDVANVAADDMLAERRQQELEDLATGLVRFAPTTVAVEAPWGDRAVPERYRRYLGGVHGLGRNEIEQIAFRVAARAGLETVWPVDVIDTFFDPEVERLAASDPGHRRRYEAARSQAHRAAADQEAWLAASTVAETLRRMNTPAALREALALYVRNLTPIAEAPDYPGPDMVAAWYRRNLRILAHLHAITRPGDRLLVVYGHGHVAVWHHLLALSDTFSVVDPEPWLAAAGTAGSRP